MVTREAVAAEGIAGGFSAVYPVLKAMEEGGRVRRGYFIEGLGAAQFALPGAVDRAARRARTAGRAARSAVLAATDPANPYGATLAWPRVMATAGAAPLARAAGASVVLVNGEPVLYVERGGRSVVTLPAFNGWAAALAVASLAASEAPAGRGLTVERINGEPAPRRRRSRGALRGGGVRGGLPRPHLPCAARSSPMPEGDSLYRFAETLRRALLGKAIARCAKPRAGACPAGAADRRSDLYGSACAGQEHAHQLR